MYQINWKHEFEVHKENNCSGVHSRDYKTKEEALSYAMKEAGDTRYTALEEFRINKASPKSKPKIFKEEDCVYFFICVGEDCDIVKISYFVTEQSKGEH
jgi:hypothetical protein